MSTKPLPKLAPPGAGIPWPAKVLLKLVFKPFVMKKTTWAENTERFQRFHDKVKKELSEIPLDRVTERVLVPPQRGLEDSSRYWSAAMTARHLTIVGKNIEELVIALSRGQTLDRVADTAQVKPEEEKNEVNSIAEYVAFGDAVLKQIETQVQNKESTTEFRHPWFGMMTCADWYYLLGGHTQIHLQQLRAIRKELSISANE